MKRFLQFGLTTALVLTMTACGPFFQKSTLAVNEFLDTLQEDQAAAYALVSDEFKAEVPEGMFLEFMEFNPNLSSIKSRKFNSWNVEGDMATVTGTLAFEDGTTSPIQFMLTKEEGEWRVLNLDLAPVSSETELEQESETEVEEAETIDEPETTEESEPAKQ